MLIVSVFYQTVGAVGRNHVGFVQGLEHYMRKSPAPVECDRVDYYGTQTCPIRLPRKQVFLARANPGLAAPGTEHLGRSLGQ